MHRAAKTQKTKNKNKKNIIQQAVCIVLPKHPPDERHLEDDFLKAFALKVSQNPEENPHSMLKSNITGEHTNKNKK